MPPPTDPAHPAAVAAALGTMLGRDVPGFSGFAEAPVAIGRGFDSFIYAFRAEAAPGLAPVWAGRLVLRLSSAPDRAPVVAREAEAARFAAASGYPAVTPVAVYDETSAFGLPLMIMPYAGRSALDVIKANMLRLPSALQAVGALHGRLHALPLDGCPPAVEERAPERELEVTREYAARIAPGRFAAELCWLESSLPASLPGERALLHNDFHPLNVLVDERGSMRVIDWTDVAVGDRYSDVGRSMGLLWFAKIAATGKAERLALTLLRGPMRRLHLRGYRRHLPLDPVRLHYWETNHTLRACLQLVELGQRDPADLTEMARTLDASLLDEATSRLRRLIARAPREAR